MCWSTSSETALIYIVGWTWMTERWSLHVWNWHEGGQADNIHVAGEGPCFRDICFLTMEKLLALSRGHMELYDVKDLTKAPQLQARFTLPVNAFDFCSRYPSILHSARLLFMNIPPSQFNKDGLTVPWISWGPQNSRYFRGTRISGVGGSPVVWVDHRKDPDTHSSVHMMDFKPSTMARGIGKDMPVATYLHYVEVVGATSLTSARLLLLSWTRRWCRFFPCAGATEQTLVEVISLWSTSEVYKWIL
ncbi:uncharacterized protein EDB91DRAFT_317384 [Suillus paluster]|uniref:uncharacterized protein n=1 Tax=Suillus paluster TaxID=48578 RepID=UPI001B86D487|nr:uncharacterized protein EDB91DRAFT_317384 [Suillus paluster]KAG1741854.1 hypothetical protein EDB91DRAFT_317384 [Suillus paluster]